MSHQVFYNSNMSEQKSHQTDATTGPRFISLRWKGVLPLFLVALAIAMVGAYLIADEMAGGTESAQQNMLLQNTRSINERGLDLYELHLSEAQRVAFTVGVPEAIRDSNPAALETLLRSLAEVGEMDTIIVTDSSGMEILGVQRVNDPATGEAVLIASTGTDLRSESVIDRVLVDQIPGATGLSLTPQGVMLFTGTPVVLGDQTVGAALVGQTLDSLLADLRSSAYTELVFYGPDRAILQTTFENVGDNPSRGPLGIPPETFDQALLSTSSVPVTRLSINTIAYEVAYQPFTFGPQSLGVVGTFLRDNVPFATETGRQLVSALAAVLAGAVVVVAFVGWHRVAERATRMEQVAERLAAGQSDARTQMQPTDELGAAGSALDHYVDYVQEREDDLRQQLQRRRRQATHLLSALESIPDGVILQDMDGRVLLMNDRAREMLGSQRVYRSTGLHELADLATEEIGRSIAPGVYALGDPHRLSLDDRMLSAQAAAVLSNTQHRLGTVIVLRDITEDVRREREREILLNTIIRDVQKPLENLAQAGAQSKSDPVNAFAREVTKHAVALQKAIVDMRDLAYVDSDTIKRSQRPLRLETLVWAVVNEWRQVARANGLQLYVIIEVKGLYVLGDEKRLRWAIGNLIDNAIRYTMVGGALTLEIKGTSDDMADLRIRDNGVGILPDELPRVFTRFYRGTPTAPGGKTIHVPGMGQGLFIAKQILEAHGGRIGIRSKPARGTAIYFSIPLTSPQTFNLPTFNSEADMDGETVQLPEEFLLDVGE